ncbi:hypothetical protein LTR94_032258, partial [Friedmanniomyces endolithicus]
AAISCSAAITCSWTASSRWAGSRPKINASICASPTGLATGHGRGKWARTATPSWARSACTTRPVFVRSTLSSARFWKRRAVWTRESTTPLSAGLSIYRSMIATISPSWRGFRTSPATT